MTHALWLTGALFGALGVAIGAFGAHALKPRLEDRGSVGTWELAVRYQLVHAVALLIAQLTRVSGSADRHALSLS